MNITKVKSLEDLNNKIRRQQDKKNARISKKLVRACEVNQMKLTVENSKKVEDGKHTGVIKAIEYRTEPYNYTDIVIEFEQGRRMKAGFPTIVTPDSKLGRLLLEFKAGLAVGAEIEPEEFLLEQPCTFVTITENTPKGNFPKIVASSIKRVEQ